jgi:hypothetical protein
MRDHQLVDVHLVHRQQISNRLSEGSQRRGVIEIAKVLAHDGIAADDERHAVLEVRSDGQRGMRERNARGDVRRISTRAAKHLRTERTRANHRVFDTACDAALPYQPCIGNPRESMLRVVVFIRDGIARAVTTRHHQSVRCTAGEQQVVDRSVGEHHAQLGTVRRHVRELEARRRENDRSRQRDEQLLGLW